MASAGQFPATIYFNDCTGVKVGKRLFATAAHCVFESKTKKNKFKIGSMLTIGFGINNQDKKDASFKTKVKAIHVHPTYLEMNDRRDRALASDIAIFEVEALTEVISIAKFNFKKPSVYQEVMIGGYGLKGPDSWEFSNFSGSVLIEGTDLLFLGFSKHEIDNVSPNIIEFRGPGVSMLGVGPEPLLDRGDSGGAVYDGADKRNLTIIGINSTSSSTRMNCRSTRIDDESSNHVGEWIRSVLK